MTGIACIALLLASCVKDAFEELNPPNIPASCQDQILNNGEYRVDCGGPCPACDVGDPAISVTIDSTWREESEKKEQRFWTGRYISLAYQDSLIIVTASDTFVSGDPQHITLRFVINGALEKGVHEIPLMPGYYVSSPPGGPGAGTVLLNNAVIKITNKDEVNRFISGEFEINSMPEQATGNLVVFMDGQFTDIPLDPPLPQ